ncbi:MAG TPA: hypothetical protein VIG06_31000 [Kofleriaceae bacterium]|jgi:hypothetical protein
MTRPLLAALVALASAAGCGGDKEQSFREGMELLCGSTASLPSTMKPSEKATAIAKSADQKVRNKEVRELAGALAALEGDQKVARLQEAARRAGIERCGLLELWAESPMTKSLRIICEAPDKVPAGADPAGRAQELADYIQKNVTDPDALELMQELASEAPGARTAHLASVAREHGIERCALAELR